MASVQETIDTLNTLQALATIINTKMDQIITKIQNLSTGGGATQAELDSINALVVALQASVSVVDQKADQALAL